MAVFLGHIYMGTIGMRGSYRAMKTGYVDEAWAHEHHRLWYDDIRAGRIPAAAQPAGVGRVSSPPPDASRHGGPTMRRIVRDRAAAAAHSRARAAPAPSCRRRRDEAKAKAAEAAAKTAWTDKVGLYKLCQAMDRVAATYRGERKADGKEAAGAPSRRRPAPTRARSSLPVDAAASKPLEASGAHSPPGHRRSAAEQQARPRRKMTAHRRK